MTNNVSNVLLAQPAPAETAAAENVRKVNFKAGQGDQFVRQIQMDPQTFMKEQEKARKKQEREAKGMKWLQIGAFGAIIISAGVAVWMALSGKGLNFGKKPEEMKAMWEDLTKATSMDDMALSDELKNLFGKVKNNANNPQLTLSRGGKPIKSILLYGPPGTGKTTFAKAIAKMFPGAEFASLDVTSLGSEFQSVTERNINTAVDAIVARAKKNPNKKFFVFIDEIDSVMMQDSGHGAKNSNDILNEFKKCFTEKLGKQENIITIGATNLEIDVEKAMLSNGKKLDKPMLDRFQEKILVDLPTKEQIKNAFTKHYKGCELVESSLADTNNSTLNKICGILSQREHETSFRTLESIYNDTAASIKDDKTKVSFKHIAKTILGKKVELKLTPAEIAEFERMAA